MKTYPVVEITFSPTGGTKKVADLISCYLGNITNESYPARCQLFRCNSPF